MSTQVITIATHKGGAGKTTTALALAIGLARYYEQRVLLIDLDPQAQTTRTVFEDINEEHPLWLHTVRELLVNPPGRTPPITRLLQQTTVDRLWVLPSAINLETASQTLTGLGKRDARLSLALHDLREAGTFDWIVIDCPPTLAPLTENGLVAADLVLVPARMAAYASSGLVDLLSHLYLMRGAGFDAWRIVRTQQQHASDLNALIETSLEQYADRLLATIIPMSVGVSKAQELREPIYDRLEAAPAAAAYKHLCGEVLAWASATRPTTSLV